MAPSNPYLMEEAVQHRLAGHHNRLIKRTTVEFPGEEPETHWDFNRPVEQSLLGSCLDRYAEPDFTDGKVTLQGVAEFVYGGTDEYLLHRVAGMLSPSSGFNKTYPTNGFVYVAEPDGTVKRGNRKALAFALLDARMDAAEKRVLRTADNQRRGINVAERKAVRIDKSLAAELQARREERAAAIVGQARLALGSGE